MYQGHCYQRQPHRTWWFKARAFCNSKKAIIAVPNTQAENDFLTTEMNPNKQTYTWIGHSNGDKWEDGTSNSGTNSWRKWEDVDDYANRRNGQPHIFMRANGDWSFDGNNNLYNFVCEKTLGVLYIVILTYKHISLKNCDLNH